MIKTARQLKDLIRNLSKDKSADAQILMRNYMMERFLERISLSEYRDKFILKGGMLVAAMVGLDARSTMDIDATVKGATVDIEDVENMIASIISVPVDDGVGFRVKRISEIMDEAEYPGIRVSMETEFDGVITPLKIDISTGDAITPREVRYSFKLMLEDRSIEILAYNLETVLAEKLETVVSRATTNTRMRDFYDLHILSQLHGQSIVPAISMRRSLQRPGNAVQRSILPTRLRPLMKLRPTQTWKSCGGLIRRSFPMPPTCRGIRSWNPSAAYMNWHGSNREQQIGIYI
jgi:predicted nucleotidyltransferase component of viral defense system